MNREVIKSMIEQAFDAAEDVEDLDAKEKIISAVVGILLDQGVPRWRILVYSWTVHYRRIKSKIQLGRL